MAEAENTQNILNIQPVYPIHLNPDWNLITRPILPVITQPPFFSGKELHALKKSSALISADTEFGLGDLTPNSSFRRESQHYWLQVVGMVWGLGPVFQFPTATDDELGSGKWSAGPTFVVFFADRPLT